MKNEKIRARVHNDSASNAGNTSIMSSGTNSFVVQSPTKIVAKKEQLNSGGMNINMQHISADVDDVTSPEPTRKKGNSLTNSKVIDMSAKKQY